MELSTNLLNALNAQLTVERFANAAYKSMEIAFDAVAWKGFAKWAHGQAKDERHHAEKFIKYIDRRNCTAIMAAVDPAPAYQGADPQSVIKAALVLEQLVTDKIEALYNLCEAENDEDACEFMRWFIREQAKSVKDLTDFVNELERARDNASLMLIDRRLRK